MPAKHGVVQFHDWKSQIFLGRRGIFTKMLDGKKLQVFRGLGQWRHRADVTGAATEGVTPIFSGKTDDLF